MPWRPAPILNLPLKAGAINIVFGPRQTGKSTAVKLLVQELLAARTTKPETILYFIVCRYVIDETENNGFDEYQAGASYD